MKQSQSYYLPACNSNSSNFSLETKDREFVAALAYFMLSFLLTGLFIVNKFWLYSSTNEMLLSGTIAGAKWLFTIIAALVILKERKWEFIKRIGRVCLIGSCVLFSYNVMNFLPLPIGGFSQFVLSIFLSIMVMAILYYNAVKKMGLAVKWFFGWLLCVALAVFLQIMLIFNS